MSFSLKSVVFIACFCTVGAMEMKVEVKAHSTALSAAMPDVMNDRYESMPPVTCKDEMNGGIRVYNINEYRFKVAIERGLMGTKDTRYTHWGVSDISVFCNKALCSAKGPGDHDWDTTHMSKGDGTVVGDARSLCMAYVLEARCREQTKMQKDEGASLTMQCFLAQSKDLDVRKYLKSDLMGGLKQLQKLINLKYTELTSDNKCADFKIKDKDACDFSSLYEHRIRVSEERDSAIAGRHMCEKLKNPTNNEVDLQKLTGIIAQTPSWLYPELTCKSTEVLEEELFINVKARKLRVHFMQSWFTRMEEDIFKGDRKWFAKALERYHHEATSTSSQQSIDVHGADEEEEEESPAPEEEEGQNSSVSEAIRLEQSENRRVLQVLQETIDAGKDLLNQSMGKKTISGWEFNIARKSAAGADGGLKIGASYLMPTNENKGLEKMEEKLINPPTKVGLTHFRNYLLRPDLWKIDFWHLVSPANYHRIFAQKTMTQSICDRLRISKYDYRGSTTRINHPISGYKKSTVEYETSVGVCSVSMINTRIAVTKQALDEATTSLTDQIKKIPGAVQKVAPKKTDEEIDAKGNYEEEADRLKDEELKNESELEAKSEEIKAENEESAADIQEQEGPGVGAFQKESTGQRTTSVPHAVVMILLTLF